jgi:hypothetical protein
MIEVHVCVCRNVVHIHVHVYNMYLYITCTCTCISLYFYLHPQSMMDHAECPLLLHHETETATVHMIKKIHVHVEYIQAHLYIKKAMMVVCLYQFDSGGIPQWKTGIEKLITIVSSSSTVHVHANIHIIVVVPYMVECTPIKALQLICRHMTPLIIGLPYDLPYPSGSRQLTYMYKNFGC